MAFVDFVAPRQRNERGVDDVPSVLISAVVDVVVERGGETSVTTLAVGERGRPAASVPTLAIDVHGVAIVVVVEVMAICVGYVDLHALWDGGRRPPVRSGALPFTEVASHIADVRGPLLEGERVVDLHLSLQRSGGDDVGESVEVKLPWDCEELE